MINQFTEGLNSYGKLWETIKVNWVDFLPIFTTVSKRISRTSFRGLFQISWSQEGSKKREEEEETTYYWELVLKMIEGKLNIWCLFIWPVKMKQKVFKGIIVNNIISIQQRAKVIRTIRIITSRKYWSDFICFSPSVKNILVKLTSRNN